MKTNSRIQKAASFFCAFALFFSLAGFAAPNAAAEEDAGFVRILSEEGSLDDLENIPDEPIPGSVAVISEEGSRNDLEEIPDEPIPVAAVKRNAPAKAAPMGVTILEEEGSLDVLEEIPDEPVPAAPVSSVTGHPAEENSFSSPTALFAAAVVFLLLLAIAAVSVAVIHGRRKRAARPQL